MHGTDRRPLWLVWLAIGTLAAIAYPIQTSPVAAVVIGGLVGVISVVLTGVGIRMHRPPDASAWWMVVGGQILWAAGDVIYAVQSLGESGGAFPSLSDACYLSAYPLLAFGLFRLSRTRWPRFSSGLIDSAIIAISLAIVYWVFVVGPTVTDPSLSGMTQLVLALYPAEGVLLCAVVIPMVLRRGSRTVSTWLLTIGSLVTLVGNLLYTLAPTVLVEQSHLVYMGYLFAYVCWAAAALHPSVRLPGAEPGPERFGRTRLGLIAGSMLLIPAVLLTRQTHSVDHLGWLVIGVGSAALFMLILARLAGFVGTVQRQAGRLGDLAMHDDLTGLANRRSFEEAVTAALATGPAQVAVIDLADFKNINDRLGREAADRALVSVAHRMASVVSGEIVVARAGGDAFALLVPGATNEQTDAVTRRVADSLRRPVAVDDQELLLNARIGVADSDGVADPGELLRRADTALDAAKRHGSRFRRYDAGLDDRADESVRLGADLRHALDRDQFRMVYQPIVALPGGEPVAVEALIRWQHPVRGFVSPADFIPVAEGNGLIVELGAWIMRTSCAQAVAWQHEFGEVAPRYVSVNVSALQLAQPDFAEFVALVLAETRLAASRLLVEVTETAIFSGGPAVETLERLRALGCRIALDDFGTGHSSLGLLQKVPVDVLKVDKSFVDNVTMAGRHAVIAEALIKVSDGLGLDAVAEGVETAEQAAELHRLGYRLAQGYHFGKPIAQPEFGRAPAAAPTAR